MTLITAELSFFFFSLSTYAALSRFITSRHSSPFDFWPLIFLFIFFFGLLHSSTVLYPCR